MSTTASRHTAATPPPPPTLPAQLVEGITDALHDCPDRSSRAQVVVRLVGEVFESVAWLGSAADLHELLSLRRLVDEATAHAARCEADDQDEPTG